MYICNNNQMGGIDRGYLEEPRKRKWKEKVM